MNWKKAIFEFWDDMDYNWKNFDFIGFIEEFQAVLFRKLATHGMSSFKDYLKFMKQYYDFDKLEHFTYHSEHTGIKWDINDLKELIFRPRYEYHRKKHFGNARYSILQDLYKELLQWRIRLDNLGESAILVDKCIHAEHNSGNLLGLNIDELRRQYSKRKYGTGDII